MSDAALPRLSSLLPAVTLTWLVAASAFAEPRVLTSIKPLQLIAAAVQDGVGTPDVLLPAGASPHHYTLRPSDLRQVKEADLVYWIGPDLEGFLPTVLECGFHAIRTLSPPTSGHSFHAHSDRQSERSDAGLHC